MSTKTKSVLKAIGFSIVIILIAMFGSIDSGEYYKALVLPKGAPPASVFPIAWGILYALMIITVSIITIKVKDGMYKKDAISYYYTQLMVNAVWPYLFFVFKLSALSFIWLILLLVLVMITLYKFYNLEKIAGLMLVPYVLWLIYAGYINLFVALLN